MSDIGIYQVCTNADTDYPIEIPSKATGALIWFEASASDPTLIRGRVQYVANNTAITIDDENMGHSPATPVVWPRTFVPITTYLHVACSIAGAVCYGTWMIPAQ